MVRPKKQAANRSETRGRPTLSGKPIAGERSPLVCLRFPPDEIEAIDALAEREGVKRSEMIRRLLEVGRKAWRK